MATTNYLLKWGYDPTMRNTAEYEREEPALAAYNALTFNRWCTLYDTDGSVMLSNLKEGPIVAPEENNQ